MRTGGAGGVAARRHGARERDAWRYDAVRQEVRRRRGRGRERRHRQAPVGFAPFVVALVSIVGTAAVVGSGRVGRSWWPTGVVDGRLHGDAVLVMIAVAACLLARRRLPAVTAVVVSVGMSAYYLAGYPAGPLFLVQLVALRQLISVGRRRAAWLIAGIGYPLFILTEFTVGATPRLPLTALVLAAAWTVALLFVAEAGRVGRLRAAEIRQHLDEAAKRQTSEERLRMARELHDTLAHHLSLINVQAGVALHLIDTRPPDQPEGPAERAQVRDTLAAVKLASKDALSELRATLDALRGDDDGAPPRSPAPSLERIDELVAATAAAGVEVSTTVTGAPGPLPPHVDLAAYRIVQEALTNVRRHAGPGRAEVRLDYGENSLAVQIDDLPETPVTAPEPAGEPGSGIIGMRERAQALGGSFDAGRRPDGGFRVRAELPRDSR